MMARRAREQQAAMWIPAAVVAADPNHPFYQRLNKILGQHGADEWGKGLCQPFYAERMGRPSLPPGTYFRILLIGYFEGIDSERGIAGESPILWPCAAL
jgi:transposase